MWHAHVMDNGVSDTTKPFWKDLNWWLGFVSSFLGVMTVGGITAIFLLTEKTRPIPEGEQLADLTEPNQDEAERQSWLERKERSHHKRKERPQGARRKRPPPSPPPKNPRGGGTPPEAA